MTFRSTQILITLIALALAPAAMSWAAAGSAEPPFRYYSTVDGLTQSDIVSISQDSAGYLWFTTRRGLNRYNGIEFEHYTISDGLRINSLTALHIDEQNNVWVGDERGGITIIRSTRIAGTIEPTEQNTGPVADIETIGDRVLVSVQDAGIFEIIEEGTEYRLSRIGPQFSGTAELLIVDGEAWFTANSSLYQLVLEPDHEIRPVSYDVTNAHADFGGELWVALKGNHVGTWSGGEFQVRAIIDSPDQIVCITDSPDGKIWVATRSKLFQFDNGKPGVVQAGAAIQEYDVSEGITSLFVDRENTLWIASESRLIRFLGDRFRHYRLRTDSDSETVWSFAEDGYGRIWFGTQTKLLLRQHDESLQVVGPEHGLPRGAVRDLVYSSISGLWVGLRGLGLYHLDTDDFSSRLVAGTEGLEILDLALSNDDAVWISTLNAGVLRYSNPDGTLSRFHTPGNTSVYTLDVAADGSVWYGADEVGLVQLIPQAGGGYTQRIHEPNNVLRNRLFDHVRATDNDRLWIATEEGGLYHFESGNFTGLPTDTPWSDQTVYLVEELANGSVVVGGEQGLYQFDPDSLRIVHYNHLAGFTGVETNVHATFVDSQDNLWIGTVDGAMRMNSALPIADFVEPAPQIIKMETGIDRRPVFDGSDIAPGQRGITVEFAAVSLLHPRRIQYSYRLIGLEDAWGEATSNHSVSYPQLPPGTYEFMVRSRYPGGSWSTATASRSFGVKPFFWQNQWFLIGAFLTAILLARALMVYRTRKIQLLNDNLRAQVAERTKSIEQAKRRLLDGNEKLSREIAERRKSDEARIEIETRFQRAFQNAPIGMGLLDANGCIFDANPALRKMLWSSSEQPEKICFADLVEDKERQEFVLLYERLIAGQTDSIEEKLHCSGARGDYLHTIVSLSAVRSTSDDLLYCVLQVQDVTESGRLTQQLEYQASYDDLTGLLNRRSFEEQLTRAWEQGTTSKTFSYLMYMDLDQFKVVNDTSGHAAGDQLLKNVGAIVSDIVRGNDIVSRLGGDEFGVILWQCPASVAARIAETIRESIEKLRFRWDSELYRIGVSIGGIPIDPSAGDTGELQQLADAACYAAKEAGRNNVHFVEGDKDSARAHRGQVRWVQRLREAMDNNRFVIHAQIIKPLAADTLEPERLEILLRLRDRETRKLIPPGAFLPAAERYGLSMELDQWVVRNLIDALYVHQSLGTEYRRYWVNLSGSTIGDPRFADFIIDAIENSPLPEGTINFEITETAVIRSVAKADKLMRELREMGCKFALDDFGSGLSSFGYLKKLPVDYLKIDGMFLREILHDQTDRIFVKSIIDIAHTLNIKTVAEFVENDEILEVMRELGADYVQGFGVGRPFALAPHFPEPATIHPRLKEAGQTGA